MKKITLSFIAFLCIFFSNTFISKASNNSVSFSNNSIDSLPHSSVEDTIFQRVDVEASFPGGEDGWREFLQNNLKAETPIKKKSPVGQYMVVVQFIVDKQGKISDITALTNHGYGMEKEVIRVLKQSPRWLPAIMEGQKVKAYRKQPITFVVTEE
jgi:periplasmic protein TonB